MHPIAALQSEYSLWSRDIENDIVDTCRELGITIVPYSPLGRGFLTGAIRRFEDLAEDDFRRRAPRFQGANFSKNLEIVDAVAAMAQEKGCTPAQLALAWVLAQGDDMVPIPGTRSTARLEENLDAAHIALDEADLSRLESIMPKGTVAGERYAADGMQFIGQVVPSFSVQRSAFASYTRRHVRCPSLSRGSVPGRGEWRQAAAAGGHCRDSPVPRPSCEVSRRRSPRPSSPRDIARAAGRGAR